MMMPNLTPEEISYVCGQTADYINERAIAYAPRAARLTDRLKHGFEGFFPTELLERVRCLTLEDERVPEPPFYPMLRERGFINLPPTSDMLAITFSTVVVSHGPATDSTMFHELVHVEQYHQLGVGDFSVRYVRGFLTGGEYLAIPLERHAYTLQHRFDSDPRIVFSVADDVRRSLAEAAFN